MSTSLSQQLQKLKAPQTQVIAATKKGVSILFDSKEAENTSIDTAYDLGLEGLRELQKLERKFKEFEKLLFSESAKSLQRAVQTAEANAKLDTHIRKFLLLLSPHLLLKPALSALEWLVQRFQIGEYNAEELLLSILPYHGTRTFVLVLRAIPCIKTPQSHWHWLRNVPDTGTPLDAHSVHVALGSNPALLRLLCDYTLTAHKTCPQGGAGKLQTLFSFCCASMLGVMSQSSMNQAKLACMLPLLRAGLASTTSCLVAGCLVVVANLVTRAALTERVVQEIIMQLLSVRVLSLRHEAGSVLLLLFTAQQRFGASHPYFPVQMIPRLTWLPSCLSKLSQPQQGKKQVEVLPLVLAVISAALPEVEYLPSGRGNASAKLISDVLEQVILPPDSAIQVIRLMFEHLPDQNDNEVTFEWFKTTCSALETKFAESYDQEARKLFALKNEDSTKLTALMGILAVQLEEGELTTPHGLLQRLSHPEESVRAACVTCLGQIFMQLPEKEQNNMLDAVKARLADDNMTVVLAVLQIPCLVEIFGGSEQLCEILIDLLDSTPRKKWNEDALEATLALLCSNFTEGNELKNLCVLLAILPHVIMNPDFFPMVCKSKFGKKCSVIQRIRQVSENSANKSDFPKMSMFSAALKALEQVSGEAFYLVSWRLERKQLCSMELLLLCKMLAGAASQLKDTEQALRCVDLITDIRNRAQVVFQDLIEDLSMSDKIANLFDLVVNQNKLPITAITSVLLAVVSQPLNTICPDINKTNNKKQTKVFRWCDLTEAGTGDYSEGALKLCAKIVPLLLQMCSIEKNTNPLCKISNLAVLRTFLKKNAPSLEQQIHLICQLLCKSDVRDEDLIRYLRFTSIILRNKETNIFNILQLHVEGIVMPTLIVMLSHKERLVRQATLALMREFAIMKQSSPQSPGFNNFILALISRDEELVLDEGHLSVLMFSLLSLDPTVQSQALRAQQSVIHAAGLTLVAHCCSEMTPPHVVVTLLRALRHVRTGDYLSHLAVLGSRVLNNHSADEQLDAISWEIVQLIVERIDESTAQLLVENKKVWTLLSDALNSSLSYQQQSVADVALSFLSKDVFNDLGKVKSPLLSLVLSLGPEHAPAVSAMLRRIVLHGPVVAEQLKFMAPQRQVQPRRSRKEAPIAPEPPVTSTDAWKKGLVLLEALQEKKKLINMADVIPVLFHLLKTCMECEQEYAKQLVLGSINNCLKYVDTGKQCLLDVELIVQCLRGTTNPHTQHQALMLLSQTAHTVPENLLHHLVSVFTFMGSLVMRHDDTYSFQVIAEVIDKVVPVIVQTQKGNVAVVLRVFVDAMPDVPAHRRTPIFTRLMCVLGWEHLWLFLSLVLEGKQVDKSSPRLLCALELTKECQTVHLLEAFNSVITYLGVLATIKYAEGKHVMDGNRIQLRLKQCGASELQDPISVNGKETRRLQITGLSFLSDLLATRISQALTLSPEMEEKYQQLLETLMAYLNILTKEEQASKGTPTEKFWPAMLHYAYSVLNKVNMLLPTKQFLGVVRGVLDTKDGSEAVRAKTLELLGARLQLKTVLSEDEKAELLSLVPTLKSLALCSEASADKALYCLRIMARQLASANAHTFVPVMKSLMEIVTDTTAPTLLANSLLCLAELCSSLKAKAVPNLPQLVPLVLSSSARHRQPDPESSELVVLAACATMQRLVETLPLFLSPFLSPLLRELCLLSTQAQGKMSSKAEVALQPRLAAIKEGLGKVPLRILLPAVRSVFDELCNNITTVSALVPLMKILTSTFSSLEKTDIDAHISELTEFFQSALELRSNWDNKQEGDEYEDKITEAENEVISSLVSLILKLPEGVFRPLYFKLSSWSSQAEQQPKFTTRCITFFRCSTKLAASLKGLFVVFAFYFLKQASSLLKKCHSASQETALFTVEAKSCLLLESVLETLLTVFSHDKQNFVNKECFDALMQPLVDQLENMLGGDSQLRNRCSKLVGPCLAQFAKATADDVLWKQLNYQVLLKTRHTVPTVRLVAVGAVQQLAQVLGEELLPLLPESVPFLAELLEDEDDEVEKACQNTVREMEHILGEPLQKYF